MREKADDSAERTLNKVGQAKLGQDAFRTILKIVLQGLFEKADRKLAEKIAGKAVPVAGAVVGVLFDYKDLASIMNYAEILYHKRFLLKKKSTYTN